MLVVACAPQRYAYYFDHYTVTHRPNIASSDTLRSSTPPWGTVSLGTISPDKSSPDTSSPDTMSSAFPPSVSARSQSQLLDITSSAQIHVQDSPLMVEQEYLSANAGRVTPQHAPSEIQLQRQSNYSQKIQPTGQEQDEHLKREEGKHLKPDLMLDRKQLKQAIKQFRKEIHALNGKSKSVATPTSTLNDHATQKLDNEVITAIVFGAVGITLSLLGGVSAAFWIVGVLCLGVGVYFFVDWLSKR
jgi:hypothetical protein